MTDTTRQWHEMTRILGKSKKHAHITMEYLIIC